MTRNELARMLRCEPAPSPDIELTSATEDSRRVRPGSAFFAIAGEHSDGLAFAQDAVRAGAVAIVGDRADLTELHGAPYFHAARPRQALGILAHRLAGDPSKALTVIGVTGTNGKSSVVALIHHVLELSERRAAKFGTLGYEIRGVARPAACTTPFGEELAEMFGQARAAGCRYVVMEVSSHALEQDRVAGIDYDAGVFTNFTQDHLDYHKTMTEYLRAKLRLFQGIEGSGRFTVVNIDDPSARWFLDASHVKCYTTGQDGDCRAADVRVELKCTRFRAITPWGEADIEMALLGRHNVSNALSCIAVCGGLGVPMDRIAEGVGSLARVSGRFEHVEAGQSFQVIVDYAHTEDGLRNVLRAAREVSNGRVIVVFGCGGDRDKTKRPKMGAAVAELGDFAVVTSDNPRTEDPERIVQDIEPGLVGAGKRRGDDYEIVVDRTKAIRRALRLARAGDLVLIAGKGHEDYQILGTTRIHFDDREVATAILQES